MAPGSTTLLPGLLGTEALPGAADLAQEILGAGAADEILGQTGSRVTGHRVDEPRARRLAGSAAHSRTAVRRDATRFSDLPDNTKPAAETSARVDHPGVGHSRVDHSWPFAFVAGVDIEPIALLAQSFVLPPTLLPARASENSLPRPSVLQAHTPSSSDLISEIFGGGPRSRENRPLLSPRVALTAPSDVAKGPDVFRNRIVRRVPPEGDSPKDVSPKPPRFSRVLDPLGTGEFIMNPLTALQVVAPGVMGAEDIAKATSGLAGLKIEINQSIDAAFAGLGELETSGVFDEARTGLKLVYDQAIARISQTFTLARQNGSVVLELQDVEALLTLAGIRYDVGRRMGVMELTRLIQDEILAPLGAQHRTYNVFQVLNLAKLHAPGVVLAQDARSSRPEERRDEEPAAVTEDSLIMGPTASAGADADTDDQGESRENLNQ